MSYDDELDDDLNDDDADPAEGRNPLREQIKRLERENKKLRADATDGAKAVREAAFLRAGVDPDDPKTKYFVKGYDGDLTREAIAAEATAAGLLAGEEPVDAIPEGERETHQRIAANTSGGTSLAAHGLPEQIAAATQRRDFQTVIALKQQQSREGTKN